jgi:hypothetical protein
MSGAEQPQLHMRVVAASLARGLDGGPSRSMASRSSSTPRRRASSTRPRCYDRTARCVQRDGARLAPSAIVFNALIIPLLVPLVLRGVRYRPVGATTLVRRNLRIYGLGGIIAPFVGIKLIDLVGHHLPGA